MARDEQGRALALRWTAHLPGSLNLGLGDLARARTLDRRAWQITRKSAIPTQNLLIADRQGAHRLALARTDPACAMPVAMLPPRSTSPSIRSACRPWPITTARAPLLTPTRGRLWTGNNRVVGDEVLQLAGDGGSALGARAKQIRDDLFAKPQLNERDLLAIQLDDRALFLQHWWQLAARRSRTRRSHRR